MPFAARDELGARRRQKELRDLGLVGADPDAIARDDAARDLVLNGGRSRVPESAAEAAGHIFADAAQLRVEQSAEKHLIGRHLDLARGELFEAAKKADRAEVTGVHTRVLILIAELDDCVAELQGQGGAA